MTITWTSGYALNEAVPFVEYAVKGQAKARSPAGTLTIDQNSLCGIIRFIYTRVLHTLFAINN